MLKLLKPTDPFYMVQPFGVKSSFYKTFHRGVDLRVIVNNKIRCSLSGTALKVDLSTPESWYKFNKKSENYGKGSPYGIHVIIVSELDGEKYYTLYGHLASTELNEGQQIKAGDSIGVGGSTGNSTAPHLHFEIRKGKNSPGGAFNPAPYLVDTLEEDGVPEWAKEAVNWCKKNKIIDKDSIPTGEQLRTAVMLKRFNDLR
jgi:murein DD-endopeptidase MepM/ murein hydrolase activator NlpD